MKKRIKTRQLNRDTHARKALFKNLIISLVKHEEIKTTKAKAIAVRSIAEKLITKGKNGSSHARRMIQAFLQDNEAVSKIVDDLGKRFKNRPGGYLTLINLGPRRGDNAQMVKLSLVEKKKTEKVEKAEKPAKAEKKETKKAPKKAAPVPQVAPKKEAAPQTQGAKVTPTRQKAGER